MSINCDDYVINELLSWFKFGTSFGNTHGDTKSRSDIIDALIGKRSHLLIKFLTSLTQEAYEMISVEDAKKIVDAVKIYGLEDQFNINNFISNIVESRLWYPLGLQEVLRTFGAELKSIPKVLDNMKEVCEIIPTQLGDQNHFYLSAYCQLYGALTDSTDS